MPISPNTSMQKQKRKCTEEPKAGLDAIREFELKQDENLRVSQKVNDKEEIIFNRKEVRRNNQRRKINVTEYKKMDKPMDNLGDT